MQALAARNDCPTELLKITAFGTTSMSKIQETGKRLAQFAETVNLPFSFNLVMVLNINDLKKESFDIEAGEFIAVYSSLFLKNLLAHPNCLEYLMRVIRDLRPQIMVITEPEANHNSQAFKDRFVETLLYFSAIFDCLEACMDRSDPSRMGAEGLYLSYAIKNSIAKEGKERTFQCVKIDFWRAYLAEFGMEETELSMTSLYQAIQVVKKFACGSYCTLDMNGKCLIIGWKGTPINSLSVWKFC
jgi:DELLA protein